MAVSSNSSSKHKPVAYFYDEEVCVFESVRVSGSCSCSAKRSELPRGGACVVKDGDDAAFVSVY